MSEQPTIDRQTRLAFSKGTALYLMSDAVLQAAVRARSDDEITAIKGIGPSRLEALRAWAGEEPEPEESLRGAPTQAAEPRGAAVVSAAEREGAVMFGGPPDGPGAGAGGMPETYLGLPVVTDERFPAGTIAPVATEDGWSVSPNPTGSTCRDCGGPRVLLYRTPPEYAGSSHARHGSRTFRLRCLACAAGEAG